MYYKEDFLAEIYLQEGEKEKVLRLPDLIPVGRIWRTGAEVRVSLSRDGHDFLEVEADGGNRTARFLKVAGQGESRVRFFVGAGYWAAADVPYTETFLQNRENGWAGGDGINSFNLTDGNDAYDAGCRDTLFIFGDTLVGQVDENHVRRQPVEMPNNTCALMKGDLEAVEFWIQRDEKGCALPLLAPSKELFPEHSWFWLQDGVVIGDRLYLSPLVMLEDNTRPEGFQFRIWDVCMVEIPIADGKADFNRARQSRADLFCRRNGIQYVGGIAYLPYHPDMGYPKGDGYLYVYGYLVSEEEQGGSHDLIVGRVRPEAFANQKAWRYFNGREFVPGIENSAGILKHISCEMSVTPIIEGENKGKFLAVFQYDVNSPFVSYAIGETPWGPFGEAEPVYECEEKQRINPTIYTYNAKAHSHLSSPSSILVSYNVNTPVMEENCRTADIYHPRFLRLHDTTVKSTVL